MLTNLQVVHWDLHGNDPPPAYYRNASSEGHAANNEAPRPQYDAPDARRSLARPIEEVPERGLFGRVENNNNRIFGIVCICIIFAGAFTELRLLN